MGWIDQIEFWHWLIAAVVLITLEMVVMPAVFFLWMGISAGVVGLLMMGLPQLPFMAQIIIFTVIAVVSLAIQRGLISLWRVPFQITLVNHRGEQYIGRVFTLEEAIVNGVGKIKVDDSIWKVMGEDMAEGEKVKVSGVDGTVFKVEAA